MSHHERSRPTPVYDPGQFSQGQPGDVGHVRHTGSGHRHHHGFGSTEGITDTHEPHHFHQHYHPDGHHDKVKVGNKRQIVGILVRPKLGPVDLLTTHVGQGITIRHHDSFVGCRFYPLDNIGSGLQCVIVDLPSNSSKLTIMQRPF